MKTKQLVLVAILFFGLPLMANPSGADKFLSYQENYPKSKEWYEFTVQSFCKEYAEPIQIKEFTSEKKYEGKSVRTVHIYAEANTKTCKEVVNEKRSKKLVIPVDNKRSTHVYVTYSDSLTVTSGH